MRLSRVKPGDIVLVSKKGARFYAFAGTVVNKGVAGGGRTLLVDPMSRGITYRHASAREVEAVYRRLA